MKQRDLHNKTKEELTHLLSELRGKLLQNRFDLADKKLKDNSQVGKTRKDIARILTLLHK